MSAKNIKLAIALGICCGPLNQIETSVFNELKDFMAHEIMKFKGTESEKQVLIDFFNSIFNAF